MIKPHRALLFAPLSLFLIAGGPCGESSNPLGERCGTVVEVVVEQGAQSRAIKNVCTSASDTTRWDTARWEPSFDVPAPLRPAVESAVPSAPQYFIEAPADAPLGLQKGAISVRQIGSKCTAPGGEEGQAECVASIELLITVVEPGAAPALSVRIDAERSSGEMVVNGFVPLNERLKLTAVVEGAAAPDVTWAWRAVNLSGGGADAAVDGKTTMAVDTSAFVSLRQTVYEVTVTAPLGTASSRVVLSSGPETGTGSSAIVGPIDPVSAYPGSPYDVRFGIDPASFQPTCQGILEIAEGSAAWSHTQQDSFLADPMAQAIATWDLVELQVPDIATPPLPEGARVVEDGCEFSGPRFEPSAENQPRVGVFRVVFRGPIWDAGELPAELAYTFVRRY